MNNYIKPEIEITKFDIEDVITTSGGPEFDFESDQIFYGDDEGYLVESGS